MNEELVKQLEKEEQLVILVKHQLALMSYLEMFNAKIQSGIKLQNEAIIKLFEFQKQEADFTPMLVETIKELKGFEEALDIAENIAFINKIYELT